MPNILTLRPDDVDNDEKRSRYLVAVAGCGRKGILFAYGFAKSGFKVSCSDDDPNVMKKLAKGKTAFNQQTVDGKVKSLLNVGQIAVTGELKKAVSQSDVVVVTVPARVNDKKLVDYSEAIGTLKQIGAALHKGVLVVYGEVAGLGFVEAQMKETLEDSSGLKVGQDFALVYAPIHNFQIKQFVEPATDLELKVATVGNAGQDAAVCIFKTIARNVQQLRDVKTAEIVTLFAATKQDADVALASELAVFCESANVDYFQVAKFLDFDEPGFSLVSDDEENKNEAYLLLDSAENLNVKLRLPMLARQINEEMVKHAFNITQDALRSCNKTLRRAQIAVLGAVNPDTNTALFIKSLLLKGAKTSLYDPSSKIDLPDLGASKTSLNEAVEGADCVVILTAEEPFKRLCLRKLKAMTKTPSVIIDLAGALDREAVEAEGFIYRGLGKGT